MSSRMEEDLYPYDEDEYQPKEIALLCETLFSMGKIEYSLDAIKRDLNQSHVKAYNFLRMALRKFEEDIDLPLRNINVEPPRGGIY
jgi:hypothetical protein